MREIVAIAAAVLVASVAAAGPLKSGLQPGERVLTAFDPVNVNGEFAGQKHCLVCENGQNPVAMIFAREPGDDLVKLVARLDAAAATHKKAELGCFVVFQSDKDGLDERLAAVAKANKLRHVVLSIDLPNGLEEYKIAKDADVTVMLYVDHTVKANFAFKKGALTDGAIDRVVGDLPKVLPAK